MFGLCPNVPGQGFAVPVLHQRRAINAWDRTYEAWDCQPNILATIQMSAKGMGLAKNW